MHPVPRRVGRQPRGLFQRAARQHRGKMLAVQADGHEILTVEGIAPSPDQLHPLQEAFRDNHGLPCVFCTPGMLTTLLEFLRDNPDPTEQEVRIAISGNLCRCTGYQGIVDAALDAAQRLKAEKANP